MVLLGGLEFVAAGYVLNELHKDSSKDAPKKKRPHSGDRRKHRKHSHDNRHDSPHRPRPQQHPQQQHPQQQQNLRPPQVGPPRPYSAPPPGSHPMWQPPQQFHGHQQQWQPNPVAYHPPQQPPVPFYQPEQRPPPPQQQQQHQQQRPNPQIHVPPPNINPIYPPPGTYVDMKTGQVQHSLYPPGENPFSPVRSRSYEGQEDHRERELYSEALMNPAPVPSPRAGYAELDSETPGRVRRQDDYYDRKEAAPPAYHE